MILGIDTSCYTTSVAIMDMEGRLIRDARRPLPVAKGGLGLRQSEAVFAHNRHLPEMLGDAFGQYPAGQLTAIAVSTRPQPTDGSYMPVFTAGAGCARILAAALRLPLHTFSHQEGHLAAALWSAKLQWREPFLALHLSGGTGEILLVTPRSSPAMSSGFTAFPGPDIPMQAPAYDIDVVGDTDLPPGQFVDRVGVALGLSFPAGAALDALAATATCRDFRLSGSVKGTRISFAGPESAAQRAVNSGVDKRQIAAAVFDNIGKSLQKALRAARKECGIEPVLIMGGVAASQNLRQYLSWDQVHFAEASFCGDNAVGPAALAKNIELDRITIDK